MAHDLYGRGLTEEVIGSFAGTPDARLKEILESLTRHLHDFITEIHPSIEEWELGIDFLTRTGQTSTAVRQEFILLSDVLGVSMLVETLNGSETPEATASTVLGPFHLVESPVRRSGDEISPQSAGEACVVEIRVRSVDGSVVGGATVDVWQADADGFYDVQVPESQSVGNGRGLFETDREGRLWFTTIVPAHYPIPTDGPVGELLGATHRHPYRPAHIHVLVSAPGFETLTTHVFVAGSSYIDSDAVFAVKRDLIEEFAVVDDPALAEAFGVRSPFRHAVFDVVVEPAEGVAHA
ncbi:dioxygenase family protein [Herbiconiux ginsengi]|uniref:Catechol 1,2-dioxygenase n=1 Tax=Herbiconiux ginsengi TaxID=381665 RepID=A0A1H3TV21_9MICO|nr:dioxygenase [Herbiconiux ginsengi]SDZ53888.1 catechol 1,2-dioxygenase [Herbiconiux ginsengi]